MVKFALKIILSGTIQEIFFNNFVKEKADHLKLRGYIRKKDEGDIEILIEGEKNDILMLLDTIKKGPSHTQIRNLKTEDRKWSGEFKEFKILNI